MTLDVITETASAEGLAVLGAFHHDDDQTLVLLGPNEPAFWSLFTRSNEYLDKRENPMDRWSQRVIGALAKTLNATALFPFGGPPYHPFISWAQQSGRAWQSPVGFLVHDTAGLFVSYRGAILVQGRIEIPPTASSPCDNCSEKPCLSACPAAALGQDGYDVPKCHAYLNKVGTECLSSGCAVRRACPIGQNKRLPSQSAFHMRAFHKG